MPSQLADFALLFEMVRERWPDAPGLPEGYEIADDPTLGLAMFDGIVRVGDAAALALCVTTAMEIGAWWEREGEKPYANKRVVGIRNRWDSDEWDLYLDPDMDSAESVMAETRHPSLPAAALAMLRGIVEP